jgi:hypothetical protein
MRKARSFPSCFVLVVASVCLQAQTPPGGKAIVQIELAKDHEQFVASPSEQVNVAMFKANPALSEGVAGGSESPGSAQEIQSPRSPDPVQNAEPGSQRSEPAHLASPDTTVAATQSQSLKIILLRPSVRFEDIHKGVRSEWGLREPEANKSAKPLGTEENYESLLLSAARSEVAPKALLVEREKLDSSTTEACAKLEALTSRLARGNVNEAASSALAELAALDEHYAILAQFVRLETGPGRSWNPNTGSITSSTDSTLVQVALISGKTGKVIWKGERLIRNKALRPTDSGFSKAITELYRDFDTK